MEPDTIILLVVAFIFVIPTLVALSSALFKLYRDIVFAFSKASDGGVTVTAAELEQIKTTVNVVGRIFMKFGEQLFNLWSRFFK